MKKNSIFLGGVIVLSLISLMVLSGISSLKEKERRNKNQIRLSSILNQLDVSDIDESLPSVLIYFNSECEHCQWELEEVSKKIGLLENYQVLLTSFQPMDEVMPFLEQQRLAKFYLKANPEKVIDAFTGGIPQTFIFVDDELVKHFNGEVKFEALLNSFKQP